jgi:hypothetical protein
MTEYEIPFSWRLAFALAIGLFWRWLLIGMAPGMFLRELFVSAPWFAFVLQIAISFAGLWLAVKWLLGSGRVASMKVMFMEQVHYQQLASNFSSSGRESA